MRVIKIIQCVNLYWHTLRHLRPVQFYGRVWFRLFRPSIDNRIAPSRRVAQGGLWVLPARRNASLLSPEKFSFLGVERSLSSHGWDDPALDKLWRYNQHYFDDLNAHDAALRVDWQAALMERWVRENTPGSGTGWEPYPTSLRIVNWVKWAQKNELTPLCLNSLATQSRWLCGRLEVHLLGNHLFANAKALVFAGLFFEGKEADAWCDKGIKILSREVPEQILSDGGHFELSTMYHALALEDMLDLCNILNIFKSKARERNTKVFQSWRDRVEPMQDWMLAMCHPDGEIAFFNDAAHGVAPSPPEIFRYGQDLGFGSPQLAATGFTHMATSGYIRLNSGPAVALLDVASIGADYLPAHAHADTLSTELSVFNQRVLVNSGTSCYGLSSERHRQRGTAAHSTVVIEGKNSSHVWAGFRAAQRARPLGLKINSASDDEIKVACSHDGYYSRKRQTVHERTWRMTKSSLTISDQITGEFEFADARYHLHPSIVIEMLEPGLSGQLHLPDGHCVQWQAEYGVVTIEPGTYHARFGASEKNYCLNMRFSGRSSRLYFTWDDL